MLLHTSSPISVAAYTSTKKMQHAISSGLTVNRDMNSTTIAGMEAYFQPCNRNDEHGYVLIIPKIEWDDYVFCALIILKYLLCTSWEHIGIICRI